MTKQCPVIWCEMVYCCEGFVHVHLFEPRFWQHVPFFSRREIRAYWSKRWVKTNGSFQNQPNSLEIVITVLPQTFPYLIIIITIWANDFWINMPAITLFSQYLCSGVPVRSHTSVKFSFQSIEVHVINRNKIDLLWELVQLILNCLVKYILVQ